MCVASAGEGTRRDEPHTHVAPPSEDERWRDVDAQMRPMGGRPEALIEVLHVVQDRFGFLAPQALAYVAATLGVRLSRVWGVATFYSLFTGGGRS